MGSIYLIRHGQASFGADDYDVLSPVGVRQAEVLGKHLEQLGISLDRCISAACAASNTLPTPPWST